MNDQIARARDEIKSWPQWMQDAARVAAATFPKHTGAAEMSTTWNDLSDAYYDAPRISTEDAYERAQSIAHDPARLDELQADGPLDYGKVFVKIDGQQRDLFAAADLLRLRVMAGRHAEADTIARDMTDALATEIEALIRAGRL